MLQVRQHEVLLALKGSSGGELALSGESNLQLHSTSVTTVATFTALIVSVILLATR